MTFNCTAAEKFRGCRFHEPFNGVPVRPMIVNGDVTFNDGFVHIGKTDNDYVIMPVDSSVINDSVKSMTWIVRIRNLNPDITAFGVLVNFGSNQSVFPFFGISNNYITFGISGLHNGFVDPDIFIFDRDYFCVITYDGFVFRGYINGVGVGSLGVTGVKFNIPKAIWLGAYGRIITPYSCGGDILEISVYNGVVLTQQELTNLQNKTTYHYINQAEINLPMLDSTHDPSNNRTLDVSGNGHHFYFSPSPPTKILDRHGYRFNGIDNYLVSNHNFEVEKTELISVLMVLMSKQDAGFICNNYNGTLNRGLVSYFSTPERLNFGLEYDDPDNITARYTVGEPIFRNFTLTGVYDGSINPSEISLYINGNFVNSLLKTVVGESSPSGLPCYIGRYAAAPLFYFNGDIYSFFVIRKKLTPLQIADWHCKMLALYNQE